VNDSAQLHQRLARFRPIDLGHLPTPLEPMERLSKYLGGPSLWVKRDDCTGLGLGGNKVRKLSYVLRDALEAGADTLVSGGTVQSNSQRQVAAAAARLGLACHLAVYHGRVAPPTPYFATSGNVALNQLFGAVLHDVPWTGDRNEAIRALADRLTAEGRTPYIVPYGVSSPLGAVGSVSTVLEIAQQSTAVGFVPDAIVHASGSGATQAGLVLGAAACLPQTRVIGIDIDGEPTRVAADVATWGRGAATLTGLDFSEHDVEVLAGHAGPAYGVAHEATLEAIKLGGCLEGLVLDPVYSGKGLAGLIALIRERRWARDDHIVFIHTGGAPALFAYVEVLGL
jgi:L-cysteate sulfo-lyase